MDNVGKICVFTGHRNIDDIHLSSLGQSLDETLERLIEQGYTEFRAGGACGFDTLAALQVIAKKKKYGFVRLHLFLPCRNQDKMWGAKAKTLYARVLSLADSTKYCSENYFRGCMHKRDREMADGSDVCVAYFSGKSSGGTAYTVKYVEKKGIPVINVYK